MTTEVQQQELGRFVDFGFTLEHPDDHAVALLHDERSIAFFSRTEATEESLQAECARHLVIKHGWNGCLWSEKQKTRAGHNPKGESGQNKKGR